MAALKMLVSSIRIDGGTQPRASIDQAIVDDYAEAFRRGDELPAAMVFHDGTSYWLADGFHRYHAARSSGRFGNGPVKPSPARKIPSELC